MKSTSTYVGIDPGNGAWIDHANHGNDATGFGAVPAGYRNIDGTMFYGRGNGVAYWNSSVGNSRNAWNQEFSSNYTQVARYLGGRSFGFSVRCVKD
jgi:uncharacterized protein (TIGR02145 family)